MSSPARTTPQPRPTVLVVGSGFAGFHCIRRLEKQLPPDAADLERRLLALPGIGPMKSKTLIAVLAKRFGVRPPGWEDHVPGHPTLGDVDSTEALLSYQAQKRAYKAARRAEAAASQTESPSHH